MYYKIKLKYIISKNSKMSQFQHFYSEFNKSSNDCKSIRYNVPTILETAMSVLKANSEYFKTARLPLQKPMSPHTTLAIKRAPLISYHLSM